MSVTRLRRDDERCKLLPESGVLFVAERQLCGFVELENLAEVIDGDHRVERGIEDRVCVRLA